jgi:hypothetical protein
MTRIAPGEGFVDDALRILMQAQGDDPLRHAAFHLLVSHPELTRGMPDEDADEFVARYFEDGLRGSHEGPRGEGPYLLGHMFVTWYRSRFDQGEGVRHRGRRVLENVLSTAPADVYDIVVLGVLEHLFTDERIARFFAAWDHSPVLGAAYREGLELAGS